MGIKAEDLGPVSKLIKGLRNVEEGAYVSSAILRVRSYDGYTIGDICVTDDGETWYFDEQPPEAPDMFEEAAAIIEHQQKSGGIMPLNFQVFSGMDGDHQ